jgi:hypothetical protein
MGFRWAESKVILLCQLGMKVTYYIDAKHHHAGGENSYEVQIT